MLEVLRTKNRNLINLIVESLSIRTEIVHIVCGTYKVCSNSFNQINHLSIEI